MKQLNSGTYDNPRLERLLGQLSERLQMVTGKKVYGYLRPKDKALVDDIVEELSKDERIARLYDLWYEQRYEVLRTYTDTMPEKEPLSRNKEFKSIRNAVIAEALRLPELPYEEPVEESAEEPDSLDTGESFPEDEPEVSVAFQGKNKKKTWWTEEYKQARHFLYGSNTEAPDLGKAYTLLCREAQKGNGFAMHDAGENPVERLRTGQRRGRRTGLVLQGLPGFPRGGTAGKEKGLSAIPNRQAILLWIRCGTELRKGGGMV